jgi:hypothetical protein
MSDLYTSRFFEDNATVAMAAAQIMLPQVIADTGAKTVIDVGCGSAAWASVAKQCGCTVLGVDGYVMPGQLLIDETEFDRRDLTEGVDCSGYDLAICLEVGEHLPESSAAPLVAGLCKATYVLFSAAHPGQGGVNHVNEAWSSVWAALFAEHGYVGSCAIRDRHWGDTDRINFFYIENVLMFTSPDRLAAMGYTEGIRDEIHPLRPR